jgi:hypothetical protein
MSSFLESEIPQLREWNINIEQIRKFVRKFRDLKANTIFTALVESKINQRTGLTMNKPSLSGKVKDEVAAFLDIVAVTESWPQPAHRVDIDPS